MLAVVPHLKTEIYNSIILIVDDSEINRILLEKMLRVQGFSFIHTAASGEAALACIAQVNPDVVVMDVMMPGGMDGFDCCQRIRALPAFRDLPVLMQTAITDPEKRVEAFKRGAADFISKPVYPSELCARVMMHLERRHTLRVLRNYQERAEAELQGARQLQQAILPSNTQMEMLRTHAKLDMAAVFRPSSEVGGDFWGFKHISPQQNALWLVDFSGHGVAAAINAFRLQALMQERASDDAKPGEFLTRMNDTLKKMMLPGQFATMFYGVMDAVEDQLHYACACAPHPLLLSGQTGNVTQIDGSGTPLAIIARHYHTQSHRFCAGDALVLYSDALIETPNRLGACINEAALASVLGECVNLSADEILQRIMQHFAQHNPLPLGDDLTIVVCKRLPPKEGATP